jgi:ABC-type Fe3+/spermidine/putrescine transport system ATPase subunit
VKTKPGSGGPRAADVVLTDLVRTFGAVRALDGVSLDIEAGSFVSLLGPSGCGKSTLLRVVAGLEQPDTGSVHIAGRDVTRDAPQARPTALVFQSYALFPSMTVGENVEYGLRVRRVDRRERARRVHETLGRVGLAELADRPVTQLSGGQQQRVAVARALAVEPAVLLFDEPLSNLDVALRERTRDELRQLQQELGTTAIYVTHDQEEALAVSDRIAVMREGRLVEAGSPETLYERPDTAYVAGFLGGSNLVEGPAAERLAGGPPPDGRTVLAVRPGHLEFAPDGPLAGRVVSRRYLGSFTEWRIRTDAGELRVRTAGFDDRQPDVRLSATRTLWVRGPI